MEDIFDLSVSKKEQDFIRLGTNLELEVSADILETFCDVPYIGSLIKIGRIAYRFQDLHFIKKVAKFLGKEQDIPEEEKENFLNGLDAKKRKKMYEYLTHYLLRAEDDAKADIMGYIYKERVYGRIDDEMFLRLCSIVDKVFVNDLKHLSRYVKLNSESDYITNNLYSCGLLDYETGSVHEETVNLGGEYILNAVGKRLYDILISERWLEK